MNLQMTKIAAAALLVAASASASAAPEAFINSGSANFTMYDPTGAIVGNFNDITGFVDWDAMTFGVASASPFFGLNWSASGGTLFGPGSYSISTVDPAPGVSGGTYNVTVGANQIGGQIDKLLVHIGTADAGRAAHGRVENGEGGHFAVSFGTQPWGV